MKKLLGTLLFIFVATNASASDMNNLEDDVRYGDEDIPADHVTEIVHEEHYLVDDSGTLNHISEGEIDGGNLPVYSGAPNSNSERESNGSPPPVNSGTPKPNNEGESNGGKLSVNSTKMVEAHNKWRAMVEVNEIKWSKKLQDDALAWAEEIRKNCEMTHASDLTTRGQGENLFYASPVISSNDRGEESKTLNTSITPSTVV
ncbi:hypothetical protein VU04_11285, partial [Desulfobulbus sp. TB]|nr:hypothetical protein [Desulfobulbus sp. TB]